VRGVPRRLARSGGEFSLVHGLRECFQFRPVELDLDERTLRVRQSVVIYQNKPIPIVQEPKSPAGRRTIKLAPEAVTMLRTHRTA
jgi:hypothetical protein